MERVHLHLFYLGGIQTKKVSVLLILVIILSMFSSVTTFADISQFPPLPPDTRTDYIIYKPRLFDYTVLITSMRPMFAKHEDVDKIYLYGQSYDYPTNSIGNRCYFYWLDTATNTWKPATTKDITYSDEFIFYGMQAVGPWQDVLIEDIYASSYPIYYLDASNNPTSELAWETPHEYAYSMKVFDLDANTTMEYEFETMPTYEGVGYDSVKLKYTGDMLWNGDRIHVDNQLFRVKTFYSRNFTITDNAGRTVMLLKKGGYVKLKNTANQDNDGTRIDSWSSTVKIVFNSNNTGEDGTFNLENKYDWNSYEPLQVYVTNGFVAFKTFNPGLYTQTGLTADSVSDPDDIQEVLDPVFEDERPDPTNYSDDVFGKINYALDLLSYYVQMPFKLMLRMLGELVQFLSTVVEETSNVVVLLSKLYGFLPTDIQTVIGGVFIVCCLTAVIKFMRG